MEGFSERFVQLEAVVKRDNEMLHKELTKLKEEVKILAGNVYMTQGEGKSIRELYTLFHKLDEKIEVDRTKRGTEHKELMALLAKKMDSDRPAKWAITFQKVMQYILWFVMMLGAFGFGNWLQTSLGMH